MHGVLWREVPASSLLDEACTHSGFHASPTGLQKSSFFRRSGAGLGMPSRCFIYEHSAIRQRPKPFAKLRPLPCNPRTSRAIASTSASISGHILQAIKCNKATHAVSVPLYGSEPGPHAGIKVCVHILFCYIYIYTQKIRQQLQNACKQVLLAFACFRFFCVNGSRAQGLPTPQVFSHASSGA